MFDKLFIGSLTLSIIILTTGIVAASLTGFERAFDIRPVVAIALGSRQWKSDAIANIDNPNPEGKPITQTASELAEKLGNHAESISIDIPTNPQLAVCPPGSIDDTVSELPATLAEQFKASNPKPKSLLDVQAALGLPKCSYKQGDINIYRYITGNRAIIARQKGDKPGVEIEFAGF
ncbi:hypothetical protein QPK87_25325 [Kamptonema cortianum]|nr:hypothetical protein [Kamptonema cortianum]